MTRPTLIEEDEFLQAAPLFRYGPWALTLVSVLLGVAVLWAAAWRADVGRRGVYDAAFDFTAATAMAGRETTAQLLARLRQSSFMLDSLRGTARPTERMQQLFAAGLGLNHEGIEALALRSDGSVVASTLPPDLPFALDAATVKAVRAALRRGDQMTLLPSTADNGTRGPVVPVVQVLSLPGGADLVVFLVDPRHFTEVVQNSLGDRVGWMRLDDGSGRRVVEVHHQMAPHAAYRARDEVRSVAQAMSVPLDYASRRLLVTTASADADAGPFSVTVALEEADVLKDLQARTQATWNIIGAAMAALAVLVAITSLALRKFATKEAYLRRLATIDILTGLPNRRSFQELLANAVQASRRDGRTLGLMFVDLDNFKDVNDSVGHEAGDALLEHVGKVLVQTVRKGDRVCRLGGDEFTVLLADLQDVGEAEGIGYRILQALSSPLAVGAFEVQARASIGIALMPDHALTESDLMRFADTAMYKAKHDGKGQCRVFTEDMGAQSIVRAQLARELAHAIRTDELFLVYQPKFCMKTDAPAGHEALVRWNHPLRGVVYPGDFIALAEQTGSIVDLGHWVLERAIRQIREWHDQGEGWHRVAVNVSALQLRSDSFVMQVQQMLERNRVEGKYLQLELTESSLATDTALAQRLVAGIRRLGVSIAVDDFGTGYSSLSALKSFDIDYLKVDRSFVNTIHTAQGEVICRAIVTLGHALQMRVIAEGVETIAQRDVLAKLDCDEVQGYLYARPMAAEDVPRFGRERARGLAASGAAVASAARPASARVHAAIAPTLRA